jgi:hypothetical protein
MIMEIVVVCHCGGYKKKTLVEGINFNLSFIYICHDDDYHDHCDRWYKA